MWNLKKKKWCKWTYLPLRAQSLSRVQLTLWDPLHCGLPGFSIHGILQAWILEWVAISDPGIELGSYITGSFFIIWATREAKIWVDKNVLEMNGGKDGAEMWMKLMPPKIFFK